MYVLGSVEAIEVGTGFWIGSEGLSNRLLSMLLVVVLVFINILGTKLISKAGIIILVIVAFTILSMLVGLFTTGKRAE